MAGSTSKTPARKTAAKKTAAKTATRRAPTGRSAGGEGGGGRTLVIVESPTKARTIGRFLPSGYTVLASVGHVRDLPQNASEIPEKYKKDAWARIGVDVDNDFAPLYVVPGGSRKVLTEIRAALKDVDRLYLATDEDREGESISWHLLQELKPKVPVRRMVFHEITERAILHALDDTRDVDENLVKAQEARRIIDRLTGYTVSPLLWTTVAPRLSAGRVQSVAVKLVVVREKERRAFRSGTWWDLVAQLAHLEAQFEAKLVTVGGKRIATGRDFDKTTGRLTGADGATPRDLVLLDEAAGMALVARLKGATWTVTDRTEEPFTTRPSPPFTTSTLQQEANRKLGLGAREAMRVAQDLYERGFITYMRTDSVSLSAQAIDAARACAREFGPEYVPEKPRFYANKSANAQEAHEAIRPSGERFKSPDETGLSGRELRLYDLIWKRTVASQMPDSKQTRMVVTIAADNAEFRASGKRIDFAGFIRAYVEGTDDPEAALDDKEVVLPALVVGDTPDCRALDAVKHETQPPARYTEASLVKALEELGIGRPSTYASIMDTIQHRGYVRQDGKALVPTFTAFAVTSLLEERITSLVDTQFTAKMEDQLDEIARGEQDQLSYLKQFFFGDKAHPGLKPMVEKSAADLKKEAGGARLVKLEGVNADIRIGRYGPYVEVMEDGAPLRASLPSDMAPGDLTDDIVQDLLRTRQEGPPVLGTDPDGVPIYMMRGEYGPYVQLGDVEEGSKVKPKRTSLPKGVTPENITLEIARGLVSLPRALGTHPESGHAIRASLGRFGPFVVHVKGGEGGKDEYRSIPAGDDVLTIGLPRALELFSQPKGRRGVSSSVVTPLRDLGAHPEDGRAVLVFDGRYGPYVQLGPNTSDRKAKPIRATLPNDVKPDAVTMAQAVQLLEAKAGKPIVKKKPARKKTAREGLTVPELHIVGGGLAGSEAAFQLAERGHAVVLHEMRPVRGTAAHKTDRLGELVCSNTFKSTETANAHGLLKAEMRALGSVVLWAADQARVPGGSALAVDREVFASALDARVRAHPRITVVREEVTALPDVGIVATGPLTSDVLAEAIRARLGVASLAFYDSIAPVVSYESLDHSLLFRASRWNKETMTEASDEGAYLNAPFSKVEYEAFIDALAAGDQFTAHEFDAVPYFEGCMPAEEMVKRGRETLRFGPMKPIGLRDPRTGKRPWAVLQLRQEDRAGRMWNLVGFQTRLRIGEQQRVFRMIPGLAEAEFLRYGSIHRNSYLNAPATLTPHLSLKDAPMTMFAGQLTGVEGYTESSATGLLAGINLSRMLHGDEPVIPPPTTMMGALYRYLREADPKHFQPMNANYGLVDELPDAPRDKMERKQAMADRALVDQAAWIESLSLTGVQL